MTDHFSRIRTSWEAGSVQHVAAHRKRGIRGTLEKLRLVSAITRSHEPVSRHHGRDGHRNEVGSDEVAAVRWHVHDGPLMTCV